MKQPPKEFLLKPKIPLPSRPNDSWYINPLRSMRLPDGAWKGLFLVALKRLEKAKRGWAEFTVDQVINFELCYTFCKITEAWKHKAFRYMEDCPLPTGRGRKKPDVHPALYLRHYTQLKRYFDAHQEWTQGTDDQVRDHLRWILNAMGPPGVRAKVNRHLIQKARTLSPSDLALEIIYVVHGVDPAYLEKKLLPRLRKSLSPLDEWERVMTSWPFPGKTPNPPTQKKPI